MLQCPLSCRQLASRGSRAGPAVGKGPGTCAQAAQAAQGIHPPLAPLPHSAGANPHLSDWSGDTAMSRLKARLDGGPRFGEVLRLVQAAAAATSPLSRAARREAGCGSCGAQGVKLSVCARCGLRSYCSRDCQVRDFPQHKQR